MTLEEENDLRALGDEMAGALQSPWEPWCVARAFATPAPGTIALTMQGWIDLEAIRSPLLRLELPDHPQELEAAAHTFKMSIAALSPTDAMALALIMRRAVAAAFALALPMHPPGSSEGRARDGFGAWLPLFAFLVAECGLDLAGALAARVDHAFALLAACRRNQGWEGGGLSYAERDVNQSEDS
jgi:hypothetical protein